MAFVACNDELQYKFYDDNGEKIFCYTIITTPLDDEMSRIHSRMPAILDADGQQKCLDPQIDPADILSPYSKGLMISKAE